MVTPTINFAGVAFKPQARIICEKPHFQRFLLLMINPGLQKLLDLVWFGISSVLIEGLIAIAFIKAIRGIMYRTISIFR